MLKRIREANENNRKNRKAIIAEFDARMRAEIKGESYRPSTPDGYIVTYRNGKIEKTPFY